MISFLYLLVALSTVSPESEKVENPIELDPVIVTARREPIRLSRTVNSAISLTPIQLEQSGSDHILSLISKTSAGVSITSVNGSGYGLGRAGHGKLLIRGLGFSPFLLFRRLSELSGLGLLRKSTKRWRSGSDAGAPSPTGSTRHGMSARSITRATALAWSATARWCACRPIPSSSAMNWSGA